MEYLTALPDGEKFVAMTVFHDEVIICSDRSVYRLETTENVTGNLTTLKPIEIQYDK